jgi:hypothetical protein
MQYRKALVIGLFTTLVSAAASAGITFKTGWNSAENSDVRAYNTNTAKNFLENSSDDLKTAINKSSCKIEVTKGCHQPNDPHFTLNGQNSGSSCKSIYAGSKSIHIPC